MMTATSASELVDYGSASHCRDDFIGRLSIPVKLATEPAAAVHFDWLHLKCARALSNGY